MANNRKRTKGRHIQTVDVPVFKKIVKDGVTHHVKNDHPKAGNKIQIHHLPLRNL